MAPAVLESKDRSSLPRPATTAVASTGRFAVWRQALGEHALALAICLAMLTWLYDLPHFDWNVPLHYHGDAPFYSLIARGVYDHGWYLSNPDVGAPFALDMHDFPIGETWHFLVMKLLGSVLPSPSAMLNVYFFLTFPLTVATSLLVLRHFRVCYAPALVASMLYAFLPYHILRGVGHFFLSCYYPVPLAVMVVLWLWQGEPLWLLRVDGKLRWQFRGKTAAALAIMAFLGLGNVYYIFFTGFLLVMASLVRSLRCRAVAPLAEGLLLILVLGGSSVLNMLPHVLHRITTGPNPEAVARVGTEQYGLRIARLVMPVTDHRVPFLATATSHFNAKLLAVNENDHAALGWVGSIGLLALFIHLLQPVRGVESLWRPLSQLNLFCVLLATVGGWGLLIQIGFPYIRSYNRICVFVGFFSLFAGAMLLETAAGWVASRRGGRWLNLAGAGLLVIVGVLDQAPRNLGPRGTPSRQTTVAQFYQEADFVRDVEAQVPSGAAIYQLPYLRFPEDPKGYEAVRMYVHATQTRWSYPVMRGRLADWWHQDLAQERPAELLPRLALNGFAGICINRKLLSKQESAALELELADLLQVQPLIGVEQQWVFFPLAAYTEALQAQLGSHAWQTRQQQERDHLVVAWGKGFGQIPPLRAANIWLCGHQGVLHLANLGDQAKTVTLSLQLRPHGAAEVMIRVRGLHLDRNLQVTAEQGNLEATLIVPPGQTSLAFECPTAPGQNHRVHGFVVTACSVRSD